MLEELINRTIGLIQSQDYKKALIELEKHTDKNNPYILYYLAFVKDKLNKKKEALKILDALIKKNPNFIDAYHLSSNINEDLKKYNISRKILESLIEKNKKDWKANYNLGRLYQKHLNNKNKALKLFQRALENNENNNVIWNAVGDLQKNLNFYEDAINTFTNIVKTFPNDYKNYLQLANMQLSVGLVDMAEETIQKIKELNINNQKVMNLLGSCYLKQSRLDEAEKVFKEITDLNLNNKDEELGYKNLLLTKVYKTDYDQNLISQLVNEYINKFGNAKKEYLKIKFTKKKVTKIGFVSADFREHSINNVTHSLFINKDKKKFEFHCFYSNSYEDEVTNWYKKNANSWNVIFGLTDKKASELIISKEIDILIFLGGYTENNRFLLGTYRSAPKQVCFHPITSSNIKLLDYWITDSYLNPPNLKENISEKLIRIKSLFNFSKPQEKFLPKIKEPPLRKNNFVSFSSFNNPAKISNDTLKLWKEVLNEFKNSKLHLKYFNFFENKLIQNKIINFFEKEKISNERIIFIKDNKEKHFFELYNNIDVALDTFPYSGATTSFGSLCMGVPVFTLTGKNYISRQSASILGSIGLSSWIENNKKNYVKSLKKLVSLNTITRLRRTLRDKIIKSHLCNDKNFYKNFENLIEKISNE